MSGLEVLKQLLDGKKLTIREFKKPFDDCDDSYYIELVERVYDGVVEKLIIWKCTSGHLVTTSPSSGRYGNSVEASLFLRDDWEVAG